MYIQTTCLIEEMRYISGMVFREVGVARCGQARRGRNTYCPVSNARLVLRTRARFSTAEVGAMDQVSQRPYCTYSHAYPAYTYIHTYMATLASRTLAATHVTGLPLYIISTSRRTSYIPTRMHIHRKVHTHIHTYIHTHPRMNYHPRYAGYISPPTSALPVDQRTCRQRQPSRSS